MGQKTLDTIMRGRGSHKIFQNLNKKKQYQVYTKVLKKLINRSQYLNEKQKIIECRNNINKLWDYVNGKIESEKKIY